MKRYLLTMLIFLGIALGAGIGVWYLYQNVNPVKLQPTEEAAFPPTSAPTSTPSIEKTEVGATTTAEAPPLTADALTEKQKNTLKTLGIDPEKIVITDAMVACAKKEVGEERLRELLGGAAPTPWEAMALFPCLKKE